MAATTSSQDYQALIGRRGLRDKVTLLTGASAFTLAPCEPIGLGELRLSDGPTGVRGLKFSSGRTVALFPNATLLASAWSEDTAYPEWSCGKNYAPIPGRETRDMGRKDYQALDRSTRIIVYGASQGGSWLERQDNVKTIHTDAGRQPLVRELGKNWYVRLPDAECAAGQAFAAPRRAFWTLLRETWDGILDGSKPFVDRTPAGQPPRFVRMFELEDQAAGRDLSNEQVRQATRREILDIIEQYRAD